MIDLLPNIYIYNPTCEFAIANGSANWQPNRLLQKMEVDLSLIPLFFAKRNDFILVDKIPSAEFVYSLEQLGITIPNFILKSEAFNNLNFVNLPKNKLLPWGWSPSAHKLMAPLKAGCSTDFLKSPVVNWEPIHREITSRKFAAGILSQIINSIKADFILPFELLPVICTSQKDFETAISNWGNIMIKAPWSSSGRGLQPITKQPVHPKVWEKVLGIVKEQGYAIAEPLLNKALDFALQFELKQGKIEFLGISNFYTNKKGQYEGNYLNGLPDSIEKEIVDFAGFAVREIRQPIINAIENSEMAKYYEGVFGVDTLVYFDDKGKLKINPCLEINIRHTMGLLALQLEKLIFGNEKGIFQTFYQPGTSFYTFKKEMEEKHPLKIIDNKIKSGFFVITEATESSLFGAYILV